MHRHARHNTAFLLIASVLFLGGCSLFGGNKEEASRDDQIIGVSGTPGLTGPNSFREAPKYLDNKKFNRQSDYRVTLNAPPTEGPGVGGKEQKFVNAPGGIKYADIEEGRFLKPSRKGTIIYAHLTGFYDDGSKFYSSLDKGVPVKFRLGENQIATAIEVGMSGMRVGGTRTIKVPKALAKGNRGDGEPLPAGRNLIYKVMLLSGGL